MKKSFLFASLLLFVSGLFAQPSFEPYQIFLEEVEIAGAPALQSYAWGHHGTKWLLLGGVTNGMHDHRPPFSFRAADRNTNIYVVDYSAGAVWSAPVSVLPAPLAGQLSSTNMQFQQVGDFLIVTGGYGYDETAADWITHPRLTVVNVPGLIAAIEAGADINPHFSSLEDEQMAVTGGQMGYLGGEFYLVGGQRFTGRYNPHNGPSFVQEYTYAIRKFKIAEDNGQMVVTDYVETVDAQHLRRRDYNMLPQVFPDGQEGFTVFSGVFRPDIDLPWLNTVDVRPDGYSVISDFEQLFNQYHTAHLPLYDETFNAMHNHFFGGIALYFVDGEGNVMLDSLAPFTKSVSRVTRLADGSMEESLLDWEMPALLGASAEFIPAAGIPETEHGVIRLQELPNEPVLAGHIYGGIESSQGNIFMQATGSSAASGRVFRVWIHKGVSGEAYLVSVPSPGLIKRYFPNPASDELIVEGAAAANQLIVVSLTGIKGQIMREQELRTASDGSFDTRLGLKSIPAGLYFLSVRAGAQTEVKRVLVE
jgi:hypothetical protein